MTSSSPADSSPSTNTDSYLWVGSSSGRWRDGANWEDQTTSATGAFPTVHNAVQFGVDMESQQTQANVTLAGDGGSASIVLFGNLTLEGTFRTGALDMALFYKPQGDTYLASTVTVTGAGNSLRAASADAVGNLDVNDGGAVTVRGSYDLASGKPSVNDPLYFNYAIRVDGAGSRVAIGGVLSTTNSSDLIVSNGGYLEARHMVLDNTLGVGAYAVDDAQSTIEVGTLGNAAAGTWTIDAGRTLTIEKSVQLSAPEFVVNGWITVDGQLDLIGSPGDVIGTGRLRIGAGASLDIGQSGDQLTAVFAGDNGDLYLADGAAAFGSTIRKFAAGDTIDVANTTFDSATWKAGVLSLFDGTTLAGTLKLAGAYAGDTFSVSNGTITLNPATNTGSAAEGTADTPNSDTYLWVGHTSGRWRDGANWEDQTASDPNSFPTVHNAVQFGVDNPSQQTQANVTVTGDGGSASLGLYGNLTMAGTFRTGALNLDLFYNPMQGSYSSASLTVTGAGDSLRAQSVQANGNLAVSGGAAMTVIGSYDIKSGRPGNGNDPHYQLDGIGVDGAGSRLTIGGVLTTDNASDLVASDGGYLEARRMVLDNTYGVAFYQVDAQSTIEVGTLGNAAAGTWTIDPTRTLVIENKVRLSAPEFVVNGWIDDIGGLDLTGSPGDVTGTGRIKIEAGALLTIGQTGDQLSTVFKGSGAELDLADGAAAFTATIRQFAAGESIVDTADTFDSASWKAGVLSLFEGTTLVGTLKMAGAYKGDTFSVSNGTITLDAATSSSSAADKARSVQLFTQAVASGRQTSALHEGLAAETQHTMHPTLAAAH